MLHVALSMLLLALLLLAHAEAAPAPAPTTAPSAVHVCPDVPAAATALRLDVTNSEIRLPGSGKKLAGLVYNGSYIGPLIRATLGDELSVDVANHASVGTSVHWHGMDLPDAAWADGVDGVTQQPIPPGATFRYRFRAQPAGTLWYHSHVGMQFADGLRGPLIVEDPDDPFKGAYDEEVVLLLTDQDSEPGERELRALQDGTARMAMGTCANVSTQDWSDAPFTSLLTNGAGFVRDAATGRPAGAPHVVRVRRGRRYRFRAIQGGASWGIKLRVRGHGLTVIALDGANVRPTPARGFVFTPGERVDFILHANQSVGSYWIDVATLTGNNSPVLLSYEGADARIAGPPQLSLGCDWALDEPGVLDFKNFTMKPHASTPRPPPRADAVLAVFLTNNASPDQSRAALLGGRDIPGMRNASARPQAGCRRLPSGRASAYCWTLNFVQFEVAANGVPLLFPGAALANGTYVQEVPYGAVVDVAIVNPGTMLHPMHLHGQRFWVLGAGNGDILTPDGGIDYAKLGDTSRAIMRDTQPVANAVPAAPRTPAGAGAAAGGRREGSTGSTRLPPAGAAAMAHGRRLQQTSMAMAAGAPQRAAASGGGPPATGMAGMDGMASEPGMPDTSTAPAAAAAPAGMSGMTAPAAAMPSKKQPPPPADAAKQAGMGAMPGAGAPPGAAGGGGALVPGYAVIRFKADNPGVWAFHCHIDLHANSGMLMAFKVAAPGAQPWSLPKGVETCGKQGRRASLAGHAAQAQGSGEAAQPVADQPGGPAPAPAPAPARSGSLTPAAGALAQLVSALAAVAMLV